MLFISVIILLLYMRFIPYIADILRLYNSTNMVCYNNKICQYIDDKLIKKHVFLPIVGVNVFFVSIIAIQFFEHLAVQNHGISSPFEDMDMYDIITWFSVAIITGDVEGISPVSLGAKIFAFLPPFIGMGGIIYIINSIFKERALILEKQKKGQVVKHLENHIIICGWTIYTKGIIERILYNSYRANSILVIAPLTGNFPLQERKLTDKRVNFLYGNAYEQDVLDKANINHALSILSVSTDHDISSLIVVLTLKSLLHDNVEAATNKAMLYISNNVNTNARLLEYFNIGYVSSNEALRQTYVMNYIRHAHISEYFSHFIRADSTTLLGVFTVKDLLKNLRKNIIGKTPLEAEEHVIAFGVQILGLYYMDSTDGEGIIMPIMHNNIRYHLITDDDIVITAYHGNTRIV